MHRLELNMQFMETIAARIANELGFSHWADDLVTLEIGNSDDIKEAIERVERVREDAVAALASLERAAVRSLSGLRP